MDDADRAQIDIELTLAAALVKRKQGSKATGKCFNCDNEVGVDLLFCDPDCRDDFEKRNSTLMLVGRMARGGGL